MRYPNAATTVAHSDVDVKTGRFEGPAGPVQPLRKALGGSLARCCILPGRRGWVAVGRRLAESGGCRCRRLLLPCARTKKMG